VVSATSFGLRAALLSDLEGFSASISAATVATATVRGRRRGIGGRGG
jgi:hypothetical protein